MIVYWNSQDYIIPSGSPRRLGGGRRRRGRHRGRHRERREGALDPDPGPARAPEEERGEAEQEGVVERPLAVRVARAARGDDAGGQRAL